MSRARPFATQRIEASRCKLQVSDTEMAWLFCVDITAYQRWMRDNVVRFRVTIMLAELLETALDRGASIPEIRRQMGIVTGPDGQHQKRSPTSRTDEQRRHAWAFIASRAHPWTELAQTGLANEV